MSKAALFFDCCDIATFYTKLQLLDELTLAGIDCDLFITNNPGEYCFTQDYYRKSDFFDERVKFALPNAKEYDILFLGARHNKNSIGLRTSLVTSFQNANRKTVIFQDAANLDYAPLPGCSAYGFPTLNQLKMVKTAALHMRNEDIPQSFEVPLLSNLAWKKQSSCKPLSKDEFYDFYNIPKNYKIVGFFPDGEHGHPSVPSSHWLHKELNAISALLKDKGYFLMSKLHPYEYFGRKKEYYGGKLSNNNYKWNSPVVNEEHAHELISYSDFALSSISCVAFEHYLYDRIHLNVGMHPEDVKTLTSGQMAGYSHFVSNGYNKSHIENTGFDITTMIFGRIYPFEKFKDNIDLHVEDFLKTKDDVPKNYAYYKDHPILGNSYGTTAKDVASSLIKVAQ